MLFLVSVMSAFRPTYNLNITEKGTNVTSGHVSINIEKSQYCFVGVILLIVIAIAITMFIIEYVYSNENKSE